MAVERHESEPISGRNLAEGPPFTTSPPVVVGASVFDGARYLVRGPAGEVRLRPRSADVLRVLVTNAGRVVSKHELIAAVWGDVAVTDDSLVQCLGEIRRALGDDQSVIRTVRGRGYLLDLDRAGHSGDSADDRAESTGSAESRPPTERVATRWWPVVLTAAVGILLVGGMWWTARQAPPMLKDTMVPEARQALDEGLALLQQSRAQVDLERARRLFSRAVELDEAFGAAHAALANVHVLLSGFGVQPPSELLPAAGAAARRALELDPTSAAAWQALAHVQTQGEWDWTGAEQSYRRAIALDPTAPMNMIVGHLLVGLGRSVDAIAESDRLLRVAPDDPMRLTSNCIVKYLARRYDLARTSCDRAVSVNSRFSNGQFWSALVLSALEDHDAAMAAAVAARQGTSFEPTWLVGLVHARAGRRDQAREVLHALELQASARYVPPIDLALLHAAVGNDQEALTWLERGYRERGRWMELIAVFPVLDPVRNDRRFRALLELMRLPDLTPPSATLRSEGHHLALAHVLDVQ